VHKAVEYFNQMANLEGQGVPLNWQQIARQMAVICAQMTPPQSPILEPAPTPEPLPEPPV
jgi:hypothetical protein